MAALCAPFEFGDDPTALYRLYDAADVLIYIGITSRPATRMRRHAQTKWWWPEVARRTMAWYPNRPEACVAETAAIYAESPRHNKNRLSSPRKNQQPTPRIDARRTRTRFDPDRTLPLLLGGTLHEEWAGCSATL